MGCDVRSAGLGIGKGANLISSLAILSRLSQFISPAVGTN